MKAFRLLMVFAVLLLAAPVARAADPEAPKAAPGPMEKVIPEVQFDNIALGDVIQYLQDVAPGFKAVVVRESGVPEEYPRIKMKLKNVTVAQIWQLLQLSYPDMQLQQVEAPGPDIVWHVRIQATGNQAAIVDPSAVKVYRLTAIIERLTAKSGKNDAETEKRSLNQILSLAKAALAQTASRNNVGAVLQVHEETGTLIFKGNSEERAALESVLEALNPPTAAESATVLEVRRQLAVAERTRDKAMDSAKAEIEQAYDKVNRLQQELIEMRDMTRKQQAMTNQQALEAEKLKIRLEERDRDAQLRLRAGHPGSGESPSEPKK